MTAPVKSVLTDEQVAFCREVGERSKSEAPVPVEVLDQVARIQVLAESGRSGERRVS